MKAQLSCVLACLLLCACSTSKPATEETTETTEVVEQPEAPKEDPNVTTIKQIFAVMNAERRGTPEFFAEDATFLVKHSVMAPPEPIGVKEMEAMNAQSLAMSSDMQTRPLRIFAVGEGRYLVEIYMLGTFDGAVERPNGPPLEPTNERIGMTMLQDVRFNAEGKVQQVEIWRNELGMMIQLGVMPSPMGRKPAVPEMPSGEAEVFTVDATTNEELVNFFRTMEDAFQTRPWDREATANVIADEFTMGTPPYPEASKERYLEDAVMFANGLSEMSYEIKESWTAGDIVIVHVTGHATQTGDMGPFKASNKKVENHFIDIIRVEDGRAVALSGYSNPLFALKQLGHFPPQPPAAKAK